MGLESPHYALPALRWLGARSAQLREADADAFQVGSGRCSRAVGGMQGGVMSVSLPATDVLTCLPHSRCLRIPAAIKLRALQELTPRDRSQATNLAASLAAAAPEWAAELQAMLASGSKVRVGPAGSGEDSTLQRLGYLHQCCSGRASSPPNSCAAIPLLPAGGTGGAGHGGQHSRPARLAAALPGAGRLHLMHTLAVWCSEAST